MNMLKIPVERLREGPLEMDLDAAPEELDLADPDFEFTGRVGGRVSFSIVLNDVLARGELRAPFLSRCVRCLEPARGEVRAEVMETWMRGEQKPPEEEAGEDDQIVNRYMGDFIEPAEVFRELIMAALPDRVYCREDCAGLCPGCGANLNREPCRCPPEERRRREEGRMPEWKLKLRGLAKGDAETSTDTD